MEDPIEAVKRDLIKIYLKFQECKGNITVLQEKYKPLMQIAIGSVFDIKQLDKKGIPVPDEYRTAAIRSVNITTLSSMVPEKIQEYTTAIERIKNGHLTQANQTIQTAALPKTTSITPERTKKRAPHIKKGTNKLSLKDDLDTRILRTIRSRPHKNPYKTQHAEYFRERLEEQKARMQTPNPNPRKTQEQKDAYYTFQTEVLASNAVSTSRWSELEKECQRIGLAFAAEPNYDRQKILEFYGIEMACLKIVLKENLPEELIKIMRALH